ncbi:MAG: hypothetical protein LBS21_04495 [Clostridiales bacterium]|jgi:hypothetical protein|nr:hypothetical protein [Clostridiales bacterium]
MRALGKTVIGAIVISVLIVFFTKLAGMFPFYLTMITETFNLANIAATDNYIKEQYYTDSLDGLRSLPLYRENASSVEIEILNADGRTAVGDNDEYGYIDADPSFKPYLQRGNPVSIRISAVYPFQFELWGRPTAFDVPVSFSLTTVGLRYYKDLPIDDLYAD